MSIPENVVATTRRLSARHLAIWLLGAAMLAGLASWGVGELPIMTAAPKLASMETMGVKHLGRTQANDRMAERLTAARQYGVFGGFVGLLVGLASGLATGSRARAMRAGLVGLVLAGLTGAGAALSGVSLYQKFGESIGDDIIASMMMHGAFWAPIGLATGLAAASGLGVGSRRLLPTLVGGLIGGLVGAITYDLLGAFFFPNAETGEPISSASGVRLLAKVVVAVCIAVGLTLAAGESRRKADAAAAIN